MKTTIARFLSLMIMMSLTMVIFGNGLPEKLEAVAKEKSGIFKVTACPTGNITFTSQAQIDAFPGNFPGCTTISGNVSVDGAGINNINGLAGLTNITGMLEIKNSGISDINPLSSLTYVGGPLRLRSNASLANINGLSNLTYVGGELELWFLPLLTNVNPLSNLTYIGFHVGILSNIALNSLQGLQNVTHVNGTLLIQQNNALTSLDGLQNMVGFLNVNINTNPNLSSCSVESICDYLQIPANAATVFWNSGNCATRAAIEASCPTCPVGNVTLSTQAQIDAFPIAYPGCTKITGDLRIESSMVNNLAPLSQLTRVTGHVYIEHTPLTSLNGLHNITNIGGRLNFFDNPFLTSLNGLSSLTSIGANLQLWLLGSLTSLSGLSNLTSVGTDIAVGHCNQLTNLNGLHNVTSSNNIWIELNTALTSLNGLHNLGPILSLTIKNNPLLSECEVLPICNFVGNYTKTVTIFGNAPNCNSRTAVAAQCASIPTCPPGDVELANQDQVVAFGEIYPDCHVINGKLKMYGSVTSLLPLAQINQVNSWLDIRVPGLTSLQGLEGITTVGVHLNIFSCSNLPNLNGLNNITSIGGELSVWASGNLTSMSALSNVTHIGGLIQIGFNNQLPNLNGLQNVTSTVGALIRNNPVLNNIDGIVNINLTSLDIQNNPILSSCSINNVCSYLGVVNRPATISNNGASCINRNTVAINCGFPPVYLDADRDGFGSNTIYGYANSLLIGLSFNNLDCVDNRNFINPGNNSNGIQDIREVNLDCGGMVCKPCTGGYCSSYSGTTVDEWIQSVSLSNGFINNSGKNGGYANYTDQEIELVGNSSYSITLQPGYLSTLWVEAWKVWIDFNHDMIFDDATEVVFASTGLNSQMGTINIPHTAMLGATRMRVSMNWENYVGPCSNPTYGEVEDYTVVITDILGCNDPNAHNFESWATLNNGSCLTCNDGILNGDEIAIDCGGSKCGPCPPPSAACGNIIDVYANAGNLAFNGPGTADVYLISAAQLDGGTQSNDPNGFTAQVRRKSTNVAFNWTNQGACIDATPNGIYNNNDKGLVYRNCLPVTPADFNLVRNFEMTVTDQFGSSFCSGRYKVIFGYPPGGTNPENSEETEAYTRTLDEETDFQVFPNPGTNQVFIATTMKESEVYSLSILDAFGKEVKRIDQIDNGFMSIETTDLVPGAYTMMLRGGETIKTLKWLKME
ncbi:MAG: T9SS type A sorting domain-containing protein [Saprospiraceae bacterium]|nr:T9SS type A sorting domain-containing protein [Saprospiraceae bacterium]